MIRLQSNSTTRSTMAPAVPAVDVPTVLAKKPRGTSGQAMVFKTNIYPLTIQKKIPYFKHDFRVKVNIKTPSENGKESKEYTRELTNSSRYYDDETRKGANVHVLHALAKKAPFLKKSLIYDRAAILFTLEELIKKTEGEEITFTLPRESVGPNDIFNTVTSVTVTVKKATDKYQITSDDYASAAEADFVAGGDKSIFELLNIATSQCVVDHTDECAADGRSRIYILNPGDYSGLQKEVDIGDGQIMRTSIKKTVKTIENTLKDGKVVAPIPAIVIDVSLTAIHKAELLSSKMKNYRGHQNTLLGLRVKKTYGNKELLTVTGFTNETVANVVVEIGDKKKKLTQFLKDTYKVNCREVNLQAVRDTKGNIFAPETLMIIEQGVKPEQNTANTSRQVILANATPGDERMAKIESLTEALHLDGDRAKQMGIVLGKDTHSFKVSGRMLPSKKLLFGEKKTTAGFVRAVPGAPPQKVFYPAAVKDWAFLVVSNRNSYEWVPQTLQQKAKAHGMSCDAPKFVADNLSVHDVSDALRQASERGCKYAFIVSDFDGDHEVIKNAEREYGIMTQQMRGKNTEKLHADTGSNVALKMNVKNGGVNFVVADEPLLVREDLLIMSLVFDHPSSISKKDMDDGVRPTCPAVIGISSNAAVLKVGGKTIPESCQNFVEKFAYANPREWKKEGEPQFKDTVFDLMKHEVEAFKNSRGKPARQIIVYVSGVPEAERGYWASDGKSLVADVCHTFSMAYNPATTIITLSTEGCERFVPEQKLANQRGPDPRIGLVIDSVVVNPKVNEFFLQSAKALKGTPRTIKYTLVAEPVNAANQLTMDQIQNLTWSLAHLHQYCFGTIGFPSPSRIAADAAKRARDLFRARQYRNKGPYVLDELNTTLGYKCEKTSSTTRSV